MSCQFDIHRVWDGDGDGRLPWSVTFVDHGTFRVIRIQNGGNVIRLYDDDCTQFVNEVMAAWSEFHGLSDNEL